MQKNITGWKLPAGKWCSTEMTSHNFLKLSSDLNWEQHALTSQRQIQPFIKYCDSVLNNSVKTDGLIQMYYLSLGLLSMNQYPLFDWLTRI